MTEKDVEQACPVCKGICNCANCLRSKDAEKLKYEASTYEKHQFSKYVLKMLLPFMNQINEEQKTEVEWEAKFNGISMISLLPEVQEANFRLTERAYCCGWPLMLKLKEWPPSSSLDERLPRHNAEFIGSLPFKDYTHPQSGYLNLAAKLPEGFFKSDMEAKLFVAYGLAQELGSGDSVTKLHYSKSDTVNVLMHTEERDLIASQLIKIRTLIENHFKHRTLRK